jgi:hypothetical protein
MDNIEQKILARWKKAKDDLTKKHYLEFSNLDEYFESTLKGYQEKIKGKPELEIFIK